MICLSTHCPLPRPATGKTACPASSHSHGSPRVRPRGLTAERGVSKPTGFPTGWSGTVATTCLPLSKAVATSLFSRHHAKPLASAPRVLKMVKSSSLPPGRPSAIRLRRRLQPLVLIQQVSSGLWPPFHCALHPESPLLKPQWCCP